MNSCVLPQKISILDSRRYCSKYFEALSGCRTRLYELEDVCGPPTAACGLSIEPTQVNFGELACCNVLAQQIVDVHNVSMSAILIESVTLSEMTPGTFRVADPGPIVFGAGGTLVLNVFYQPQQRGAASACLVITAAGCTPVAAPVTGLAQ